MLENSLTNDAPPTEIQPDETGLTPAQTIGKKLRRKRTRLPDVLDDTPAVPATAPSPVGAEQPAPAVNAKAQMHVSPEANVVSADVATPLEDEATEEEGDPRKQGSRRGGRKRLLLAAGAIGFVAVFIALMASAVWFAFYRSAGGNMQSAAGSLGLTHSTGSASGATAADPTASPEMPVSADEIRRKTGAVVAGATAPATAGGVSSLPDARREGATIGAQQQMPPAYAQMGGAPISERLPYDSLSTTIAPPSQSQQLKPTSSAHEPSAGGYTAANSSQTRNTGGGEIASDSTATSANDDARRVNGDFRDVRGTPIQEHSIRAFAAGSTLPQAKRLSLDLEGAAARAAAPDGLRRDETTGVAIPPLGTLLPVRTLGAIYTLRSSALVRLQLTRDVGGARWSLRRGTELYGTLRGSDYDIARAYVSLVGFVDPRTNRLVRMSGDLLGGDGAEGLRGTRRPFHSRWSRAFRVAGTGALDVLSSAVSGFGRRTVVVTDLYGDASGRAISPLTQELNRTASGNRAEGFVEVPSAAAGYVLVLTMPAEEQGKSAEPEGFLAAHSGGVDGGDQLARYGDAAPPAATTSMTDDELANLLRVGSPEQIRRAWSRMSPEMRRVASRFLEDDGE